MTERCIIARTNTRFTDKTTSVSHCLRYSEKKAPDGEVRRREERSSTMTTDEHDEKVGMVRLKKNGPMRSKKPNARYIRSIA